MTTNEREIAIREGHKIHAETSYFTPRPQLDFVNARYVFCEGFDRGYIAATAEANKRIAELEGEVAELKGEKVRHDQLVDYLKAGIAEELEQRILELQANNHDLREASQALIDRWDTPKWKDAEHTAIFINALRNALSATPAESLQAFENEVIEKCANAIDEMVTVYTNNCDKYKAIGDKESTERNVNKGRAAISCAEVIRVLKGK